MMFLRIAVVGIFCMDWWAHVRIIRVTWMPPSFTLTCILTTVVNLKIIVTLPIYNAGIFQDLISCLHCISVGALLSETHVTECYWHLMHLSKWWWWAAWADPGDSDAGIKLLSNPNRCCIVSFYNFLYFLMIHTYFITRFNAIFP